MCSCARGVRRGGCRARDGRRAPACGRALALLRTRITAAPEEDIEAYDPGRERRAEARARELLRSCVSDEDWEMYRTSASCGCGAPRATGGRDEDAERPARPTPT